MDAPATEASLRRLVRDLILSSRTENEKNHTSDGSDRPNRCALPIDADQGVYHFTVIPALNEDLVPRNLTRKGHGPRRNNKNESGHQYPLRYIWRPKRRQDHEETRDDLNNHERHDNRRRTRSIEDIVGVLAIHMVHPRVVNHLNKPDDSTHRERRETVENEDKMRNIQID